MRAVAAAVSLAWLASASSEPPAPDAAGPLAWFAPWIELDAGDARDVGDGRVVAKTIPAGGSEIAVLIGGRIEVDPDTFVAAVRDPERLWTSPRVPRVRQFSTPPRLEDLAALRLPDDDVEAIRRCRPGDCDVKLAAGEIRRLQAAESIEAAFRQVVLDRVTAYLADGLRPAEAFHDHDEPIDPQAVAGGLLRRSPWLTEGATRLAGRLERFAGAGSPAGDSFLYWLETTYTPKPTVQVVHVTIDRPAGAGGASPDVLVASRQVYASHYLNGSLSLTALTAPGDGARSLVYVTRAHVDGVQGFLSGLRRLFIERGVRRRGAAAFELQRRRLETWDHGRAAARP